MAAGNWFTEEERRKAGYPVDHGQERTPLVEFFDPRPALGPVSRAVDAFIYSAQPPTQILRDDLATEAKRQADKLANHGAGKVARVRIKVEFGDGSIVAHEVKRAI